MPRPGNRFARRFSSRPGRIRQSFRLRPRPLELLEDRLAPVADFGFAFGLGGAGINYGLATAVDGANNVYVTGYFQGTVDFDPDPSATFNLTSAGSADAYVAKYDGQGHLIWAQRMGGTGYDRANAIAVSGRGEVNITGEFSSPIADFGNTGLANSGSNDVFVSQLDAATGDFLWTKGVGGAGSDRGFGVAVDNFGDVYLTGHFEKTVDFDPDWSTTVNLTATGSSDIFVAKFRSWGQLDWARAMGGVYADIGYDIAVDDAGNVVTTGSFAGTADFDPDSSTSFRLSTPPGGLTNTDAFVSKLNSSGNFVWAGRIGGTDSDSGRGLVIDGSNNIILTGAFAGEADLDPDPTTTYSLVSAGGSDAFVAKLAPDGKLAWAAGFSGGDLNENGYDVTVDADGNVYSTGAFISSADFDPSPDASHILTSPIRGTTNAYVSKLGPDGRFDWAREYDGDFSTIGFGIAVDGVGNVYTTGSFTGTVDFDPDPDSAFNLTAPSGSFGSIFLAKLTQLQSGGDLVRGASVDGYATDLGLDGVFDALDTTGTLIQTFHYPSPTDQEARGLIEFSLAGVDPSATVVSAVFSGDVWVLAMSNAEGQVDVDIYGYAGDGALSLSDASAQAQLIGQIKNAKLGAFAVTLDPAFIQSLLGKADFVGLSLRITRGGQFFIGGSEKADSEPPTLTLQLEPASTNQPPVSNDDVATVLEDGSLTVAAPGVLGNDNAPAGGALTATLLYGATVGSLDFRGDGSFTYVPPPDFNGLDRFTYRASDGQGWSRVTTVTILVTPVNDAPQFELSTDNITVDEDASMQYIPGFAINMAPGPKTALDEADQTLAFDISAVTSGGLTFNYEPTIDPRTGDLLFIATPNTNGVAIVTARLRDSGGTANGGVDGIARTFTITVNPANDPPTADGQYVTTPEDTPKPITLSGSDIDGDALTYIIVDAPAHGALSGTAPNLVYTPNANYNGTDRFTFRVSDGGLSSYTATVSIDVTPVNDAPTAADQSITTDEDAAQAITLVGSDVDGNRLNYIILVAPTHGALSGAAPNLVYTPNADYNGPDSFTFRVSDGALTSDAATVFLTVNPVNDAPTATGQSITTDENAAQSITLIASDIDGDALTYIIVEGPAHGALSGAAPNLVYTPNANYNGPDSFTFRVSDGGLDSNVATISIAVASVNHAPTVADQSASTLEDIAKAITLIGSDIDGDSLTYTIVEGPSHGALSGAGPNLVYTPNADYNGLDSFTFQVSDGALTSAPATVFLTVNPVNDAPTATGHAVTTDEDAAQSITLSGSDIDGDTLTYIIVEGPAHGALSGAAPNLVYTPNANYNGADRFTFRVSDGGLSSYTATVSITVSPVNDAPIAADQSITTDEDAAQSITLVGSDIDGDLLTYIIVSGPTHGALTGTAPNLIYTPNANYNGPDSFTFRVSDGALTSDAATVFLTVNPVNDAPTASNQSITTDENAAQSITLIASDIDGDALTYTIVEGPAHGALSGEGRDLVYTPNANYSGPDGFTFRVNDGGLDSNVATVSIAVASVNHAPTVADQSVSTLEDIAQSITLSASDIDGDTLNYIIIDAPKHGALSGTAPNLVYTPNADYNGSDGFTFQVSDGALTSAPATVFLTVNPVNDAPTATGQAVTTDEDAAQSITLVGSDIDGDALTYAIIDAPVHGTLSGAGPNLVYTPNANYSGSDSFTFRVNDGGLDSNVATISIAVNPVNDAPTAIGQAVTTDEDAAQAITLVGSDIDGDSLTYIIVSGPAHGALSGEGRDLVYTPNADYNGPDSFTFQVSDGSLTSVPATVSITIKPVNDAPTAADDAYTTAENTPLTVSLPGVLGNDSDVEGDHLLALLVNGPARGALAFNADGSFTYTPTPFFSGVDSFTYQVSDGQLASAPATVTLTIQSSGGAPLQASAGADQEVDEGGTLSVFGSGAAAPGHAIVAYEWDFDYDGVTFDVDASGANASTSYPDDGIYTIALRVRDDTGQTVIDTLNVVARNVAPSVSLVGPSSGVRGQTLTFNGGFTDPGSHDTHTAVWQVLDDGGQVAAAGTGMSFAFVPTSTGAYTIRLTVTDDDGGQGSASQAITVSAWDIQPDPCDPSKTALVVGGTPGDDQIVINPGGGRDGLKVIINGVSQNAPTPSGRVIVLGQAGNDNIQVAGGVKLPTLLIGGPGDDRLKGGNGVNVLIGGPGTDQLNGGKNDLLIPDAIDLNDQALCALLDEWASANPDSSRILPLINRSPWTSAPSSPADSLPNTPIVVDPFALDLIDPSGRGKKKS